MRTYFAPWLYRTQLTGPVCLSNLPGLSSDLARPEEQEDELVRLTFAPVDWVCLELRCLSKAPLRSVWQDKCSVTVHRIRVSERLLVGRSSASTFVPEPCCLILKRQSTTPQSLVVLISSSFPSHLYTTHSPVEFCSSKYYRQSPQSEIVAIASSTSATPIINLGHWPVVLLDSEVVVVPSSAIGSRASIDLRPLGNEAERRHAFWLARWLRRDEDREWTGREACTEGGSAVLSLASCTEG